MTEHADAKQAGERAAIIERLRQRERDRRASSGPLLATANQAEAVASVIERLRIRVEDRHAFDFDFDPNLLPELPGYFKEVTFGDLVIGDHQHNVETPAPTLEAEDPVAYYSAYAKAWNAQGQAWEKAGKNKHDLDKAEAAFTFYVELTKAHRQANSSDQENQNNEEGRLAEHKIAAALFRGQALETRERIKTSKITDQFDADERASLLLSHRLYVLCAEYHQAIIAGKTYTLPLLLKQMKATHQIQMQASKARFDMAQDYKQARLGQSRQIIDALAHISVEMVTQGLINLPVINFPYPLPSFSPLPISFSPRPAFLASHRKMLAQILNEDSSLSPETQASISNCLSQRKLEVLSYQPLLSQVKPVGTAKDRHARVSARVRDMKKCLWRPTPLDSKEIIIRKIDLLLEILNRAADRNTDRAAASKDGSDLFKTGSTASTTSIEGKPIAQRIREKMQGLVQAAKNGMLHLLSPKNNSSSPPPTSPLGYPIAPPATEVAQSGAGTKDRSNGVEALAVSPAPEPINAAQQLNHAPTTDCFNGVEALAVSPAPEPINAAQELAHAPTSDRFNGVEALAVSPAPEPINAAQELDHAPTTDRSNGVEVLAPLSASQALEVEENPPNSITPPGWSEPVAPAVATSITDESGNGQSDPYAAETAEINPLGAVSESMEPPRSFPPSSQAIPHLKYLNMKERFGKTLPGLPTSLE